jgi:hypothetical protein
MYELNAPATGPDMALRQIEKGSACPAQKSPNLEVGL